MKSTTRGSLHSLVFSFFLTRIIFHYSCSLNCALVQLMRCTWPGSDTNFWLLGDYVVEGCSPRASANKRISSSISDSARQATPDLSRLPNGAVEFSQVEPKLGDVTKNLSAVIGRAFPAHELLPFQAIQQAGYTRRLFDHPLCDAPVSEAPPGLRLAGCAGRCIAAR